MGIPKLMGTPYAEACACQKASIGNVFLPIDYNQRVVVNAMEQTVLCDGVDTGIAATTAITGWGELSWYIFNSHAEPTLQSNMRLYGLKMRTNGVPIRNFIPCVRKADSKPGMYDTVTKTFYTNAGTGEFIVPA